MRPCPLPRGIAGTYYVFVETNANGTVYEQNTTNGTAYDPQPVQINLPPPADLVAGTVTVPGERPRPARPSPSPTR